MSGTIYGGRSAIVLESFAQWYVQMHKGLLLGPMSRENREELARQGAIVPADQIRQGEDGRWCQLSEIHEVSETCRSERGDIVPDAENEIEKRRSPKGHEAKRKIRPLPTDADLLP